MGVYIKGMTLEQFNEFLDILDLIGVTVNQSKLIEVTEPHGRLIDADKLDAYKLPSEKQDFKTWHKHSEEYKHAVLVFNSALDMVKNNAPTVIEADGE